MARQSSSQKNTVGRVMHEFKHGELETRGRKVKNPKQAVAIALSEAGESREQSPSEQKHARAHTRHKEERGETAQQEKEGDPRRKTSTSKTDARKTAAGKKPASKRPTCKAANKSGGRKASSR